MGKSVSEQTLKLILDFHKAGALHIWDVIEVNEKVGLAKYLLFIHLNNDDLLKLFHLLNLNEWFFGNHWTLRARYSRTTRNPRIRVLSFYDAKCLRYWFVLSRALSLSIRSANDLEQRDHLLVVFIVFEILLKDLKVQFFFQHFGRKLKLRVKVSVAPTELSRKSLTLFWRIRSNENCNTSLNVLYQHWY